VKAIKVNILGRELSLKSESGEEYINEVVDYVKHKIETVQKAQSLDLIPTVILTALNIADDYLQLCRERESLMEKVEKLSIYLSEIVDS
jgi:cell division protein ZapA (FtsZ GTPase activity inhibitor)